MKIAYVAPANFHGDFSGAVQDMRLESRRLQYLAPIERLPAPLSSPKTSVIVASALDAIHKESSC